MSSVDEVTQEGGKFVQYQRAAAKHHQNKLLHLQRRATENSARTQRGEPPLPDEDINKLFKPVPQPPRMDALLAAGRCAFHVKLLQMFAKFLLHWQKNKMKSSTFHVWWKRVLLDRAREFLSVSSTLLHRIL